MASMKKVKLLRNGIEIEGFAEKVQGTLWVHLNGRTFPFSPQKSSARRGGDKKVLSENVVAPMPGKITKCPAKVGDKVEAQQTILVMEAMKMEYSLKAPAAAEVIGIDTQVGVQVKLGDVLVRLKFI